MRFFLLAFSSIAFLQLVQASPAARPVSNSTSLQQRSLAPSLSCSRINPWDPACGPYFETLTKFMANAFWITSFAAEDKRFSESSAYLHYFFPSDSVQVRNMLVSIARALSNMAGTIPFDCGDDMSGGCSSPSKRRSEAMTKSRGKGGRMTFCDGFFDKSFPATTKALNDRKFDTSGWCEREMSMENIQLAAAYIIQV